MKSTFEILFELFDEFIHDFPNSHILLLIDSIICYFCNICWLKSAAYALLEVKRTNRQKRIIRQTLYSMSYFKSKFMVGYVKMTVSRKNIMKFIVTENYISKILTYIILIFLIISLIYRNIAVIGWYIFVFKFIICDFISFIFTFIYGGIAWDWKFE